MRPSALRRSARPTRRRLRKLEKKQKELEKQKVPKGGITVAMRKPSSSDFYGSHRTK